MQISMRIPVCAVIILALAFAAGGALAQEKPLKEQLVGTWIFESSTNRLPDGSPLWGANPRGVLIFTDNGRFTVQIMRSDRRRYSSNDRLKGTPEEHKAAAEGTISYFGTYSVSDADKTITYRVVGSSYPNWEGTEQKRPITSVTANELIYRNPAPSAGGQASELVWKRAR